jgi:hypothetical protein
MPSGSVAGLQRRQRDDDRDRALTHTRSVIMKFPGGGFGYRHPRTLGAAEIVVGMWVVFLEAATAPERRKG